MKKPRHPRLLSTEQELAVMKRALRHLIASYRGDEPVGWLRQILKGTYFDEPAITITRGQALAAENALRNKRYR